MIIRILTLTLVAISARHVSEGANIVFLHHVSSYSHGLASQPLAEALLSRGHNVTYIAPFKLRNMNPNITFIIPKRFETVMTAMLDDACDIPTRLEQRMPNWRALAPDFDFMICTALLQSEELHSWINSTENNPIDLVYIDSYPGVECGMAIAHKLGAKMNIFNTIPMNPTLIEAFGLPAESSSLPTWDLAIKPPMTFFQRILNTLNTIGFRINQVKNWQRMGPLIKEHLNLEELPTLDELYRKVGIILMNGHYLDERRRALPPMMVSAPGLHFKHTKQPLAKEVEAFITSKDPEGNPSEGFVFVSFGTLAKAKMIPQNILDIFFNSMRAFPKIRFLWRWDGDLPQNKPKNLLLAKWFNQQDLLGHSRIRGFISQVGRQSTQEIAYNGVPVITFPILGDQDFNAHLLGDLGVAINLEIGDVTEEKLTNALDRLLNDKSLREKCREVSQLYKDLPMKPIETAVWWTEYVLRHKNTDHLKPLAMTQTWYERRLLDVWAFVSIVSLLVLLLCGFMIKLVIRLVSGSTKNVSSGKDKLKVQ